jgi:glycosyltransferase involved in cell wall biosynthesis
MISSKREVPAKFFLLDPNLTGHGGHYFPYATSVSNAAAERGLEVHWAVSVGYAIPPPGSVSTVIKVFENDVFFEKINAGGEFSIHNYNESNKDFFLKLVSLELHKIPNAIFFFPSVIQNQLYAISEWSKMLGPNSHSVCVLRWHNAALPYNRGRGAELQVLQLYAHALNNCRGSQTKISLCSDTRRLASFYESLSGVKVEYIPNPQSQYGYEIFRDLDPVIRSGAPVVGFYGAFTRARGANHLASIFETILRYDQSVLIRCQIGGQDTEDITPLRELQARNHTRMALLSGNLDSSLYYLSMASTSLVIMPFTRAFYGHGSSGIASEAISLAVPAVVTEDTSVEDEYAEVSAGYLTAQDGNAASFADAACRALSDLPELMARARAASIRYRLQASPNSFVASLLSF